MRRTELARSTKPLARTKGVAKTRTKPITRTRKTSAATERAKALTLWGRYVHLRDGHCQYCGKAGGKLDAHHIIRKERNATRTDENNGVLLCAYPCHRTVMHGDSHAAEAFYAHWLGVDEYAALRQKANDGINHRYGIDFWRDERARLTKLIEAL